VHHHIAEGVMMTDELVAVSLDCQ